MMKRSLCAFLSAASLLGCQSPGKSTIGPQPLPYSVPQSTPLPYPTRPTTPLPANPAGVGQPMSSAQRTKNPDIVQVGYNHGHGMMQNRQFYQKVGKAVPSPMPAMGGMPMGPQMPGMGPGIPLGPRFTTGRTQVRFVRPTGMKIAWQSSSMGGNSFTPPQLEAPARYNYAQANIYRLKLTDIPNRGSLELYPTLEVFPGNAKVDAYLAHNAVPVEITDEDIDQVQAGNFVTKVIYLPDPAYQELAIAGIETLVSTRLDPGVDPVQEANKRGSILLVIRLGGVDLEMSHSPSLFQPAGPPIPPGGMPMPGMGMMPGYGGMQMPGAGGMQMPGAGGMPNAAPQMGMGAQNNKTPAPQMISMPEETTVIPTTPIAAPPANVTVPSLPPINGS